MLLKNNTICSLSEFQCRIHTASYKATEQSGIHTLQRPFVGGGAEIGIEKVFNVSHAYLFEGCTTCGVKRQAIVLQSI
jgi:hypothetical protein